MKQSGNAFRHSRKPDVEDEFLQEAQIDLEATLSSTNSPAFGNNFNAIRQNFSPYEKRLDKDRQVMKKVAKIVKSVLQTAPNMSNLHTQFAECLDEFGDLEMSRDDESYVGMALLKFSVVHKELVHLEKDLHKKMNNILLFPLDALLKADSPSDLKKQYERQVSHYEQLKARSEKKNFKEEAERIEAEQEADRGKRMLQVQTCDYLLRMKELKAKKDIDFVRHLTEYYHAQQSYIEQAKQTLEGLQGFVESVSNSAQEVNTIWESWR